MYIPKRYGQSKTEICPFCGKNGVTHNSQGISVCTKHKNEELSDLKCVCGEWLDVKKGKWGPYFSCMRCGNINFKKAMEMNPNIKDKIKLKENVKLKENIHCNPVKEVTEEKTSKDKQPRKEITMTSDEIDLY